jgi:hypothetical protein
MTIAARRMLDRIRAEYLEMPGMRLTTEQVQRLCGVDASVCQVVMDSLVAIRFLCVHPDGTYVRMSEDSVPSTRLVSSRRAS